MELHKPRIITDGGPWAKHDQECAVKPGEYAVLNLNTGIFYPSWKAKREGWRLVKTNKFQRFIMKIIGLESKT